MDKKQSIAQKFAMDELKNKAKALKAKMDKDQNNMFKVLVQHGIKRSVK